MNFPLGAAPRPPAQMGHNGGPPMVMDGSFLGISDAEQRVWAFFNNQITRIENEVFETIYPNIRYPQLVPVDTTGGPWLQSVTYFSTDRMGQAQWFHAGAQDVPLVGMTRNQYATTVQMAAIGYGYNEEELAVATSMGMNLTSDKADACRRAAEEFIDRVVLFGDTTMGFTGLTNAASVASGNAAADGAGSATTWSSKTADQILRDVNAALAGIWTASNTVEMADTLLLPLLGYTDIVSRPRSATDAMTVLQFIQQANIFTAETGRPLTIRGIYGLNSAGAGGTGRMIAYRRSPDVLKFHMPMPFQFRAPWRKGPLMFEVPGIFRLGGLDVRRPGAMRYIDGITPA